MLSSTHEDGSSEYTCFFYGTLMSVDILRRVIGTTSDHLEFADALLKGHTRHHVRGVDYPAVVRATVGKQVLGRDLTDEEASVRGTVVKGLTKSDIRFLDTFEGDEYTREVVLVDLLSPFMDADSKIISSDEKNSTGPQIQAGVYLWIAPTSMLEPALWTFEEFMRDKAHMWIGNGANDAEYMEVDRRRQMEGKIIHKHTNGTLPAFGHSIRQKEFSLEPGYINLNHGGLGAVPKRVMKAKLDWLATYESAPDKFWRNTYFPAYNEVKAKTAEFLDCESDNLALVLNATTGVNTVLRSIRWKRGDRILYFPSAVYGACHNTLLYLQDHYTDLDLQLVPVKFEFPISHAKILSLTEQVVMETKASLRPGERIHLGLMDAICSRPGTVMPWVELCALFKDHGILSLVDAAHLMGHMPVSLTQADPDFWVSNAHKWCFAPRSLAVLHVPARNHHLIESLPISFGYKTSKWPKTINSPSSFAADFSYNGTQDVSNILAFAEALEFRKSIGGEERILSHNYDLMRRGAALLAESLGTEVMQNEEENLVACMANVRVPVPTHVELSKYANLADKITGRLMDDFNISATPFPYNDKLWIRIAAQIYNELSDYEKLAAALKEILADIDSLI